jgi:putative transposase
VPTAAGFLYLAVVLDAWSRKIVGWSMANHLRTELVLDAMAMAVGQRRPKDVIHHSDQGSQYTSVAFGKRCGEAGVRPSMGSVGDAYDNAMAESFFPPSRPNSSAVAGSHLKPRPGWPASPISRVGTIQPGWHSGLGYRSQ